MRARPITAARTSFRSRLSRVSGRSAARGCRLRGASQHGHGFGICFIACMIARPLARADDAIKYVACWPEPEVKNNIDMTTGRLGLSDHEEDLIVIFLGTLTDGFTTPYPDADKYTGDCLPPAALSPPPPAASAAPFPPGLTPPPL